MSEKVVVQKSKFEVRDVVVSGLSLALVFVATKFINIRLPVSVNGGLIHMGNVALFVVAIVFGKKTGAFAGALGMFFFDLLSGWAAWAPFTLVIRGVMGYAIGSVSNSKGKNGTSFMYNLLAILLGSVWMLAGYYAAEAIIYKNWAAPVTSIPGNLTQLVIGAVIGLPIASALKKLKVF